MTCHHKEGDPECEWRALRDRRKKAAEAKAERDADLVKENKELLDALAATRPDPSDFLPIDSEQIGPHLVFKAQFPSCAKCSYEGYKVLVYLNTSVKDALRWRELDPHFRPVDPLAPGRAAPPPDARFPASPAGWADALEFARLKAAATAGPAEADRPAAPPGAASPKKPVIVSGPKGKKSTCLACDAVFEYLPEHVVRVGSMTPYINCPREKCEGRGWRASGDF
jgi:hypothetical protein